MNDATSIIYNYDQKTGEFLNEGKADISPVNKNVYLYPAFCTLIEPPETNENQAAIFKPKNTMMIGDWVLVDDYRGQTWYTVDGLAKLITEFGNPADNGLLVEKPTLPEPEPVVPTLTKYQLLTVIEEHLNKSEEDITNIIQGIKDEFIRSRVKRYWDASVLFHWNSPNMQEVIGLIDLPLEQLKDLWIYAATLEL